MQTIDYGRFSQAMHRKMIAAGLPLSGTIEVTRRCPLTCAHCYNNLPMGDRGAAQRELSCDEHCRLLDELSEAGCLWLLYTGGEIFARRDFIDIYSYARRRGLLITLFTNGTLITPALADRLVEERPFAIEITLYGRTRDTYERLTGIPGSYDRCMRGIRLLHERGLPLSLKTVAVTINKHEVFAMQQFAEDELGRRIQVRRDDESAPRLLSSAARRATDARRVRVVRCGRPEAHGRVDDVRETGADGRGERSDQRRTSTGAVVASPPSPSTPTES